jgi:hypothetical protein
MQILQLLLQLSLSQLNEVWLRELSGSMLAFADNTFSQQGEDGILAEVFRRLRVSQGHFVDVGASDGATHSNTRLLIRKGWSGTLVEADALQFRRLSESGVCESGSVVCLHERVGFRPGERTLDGIFASHSHVNRIDFLSIDIDGNDLDVLGALAIRSVPPVSPHQCCCSLVLRFACLPGQTSGGVHRRRIQLAPTPNYSDIAKRSGPRPPATPRCGYYL